MARIKLAFPEKIIAQIVIPVRITDLNYGNHVGNDAFVSIIHEARVQWLQQHHFTELNIGGSELIMGDLAIEFKKEAFYGDVINIEISVDDISKISFDLYYQLSTLRDGNKIILVNAKTRMICYNYTSKKITSLPEIFLEILK